MNHFAYLRPQTVAEAANLLLAHGEARLLAGGQSLLAAMKLGLSAPSHLVDLQDVPGLRDITQQGDQLHIGAMVPHAQVAASNGVRAFCPMLADLAGGIADQQVREVGTLGGSLANNDPAACWPAGVLALNATVCTNQREISADDFFQGIYATALHPGELILGVRFPRPTQAAYRKQEQAASRFALVGVAVARLQQGNGHNVRVAITGLGQGVVRWPEAEQVLTQQWSAEALDGIALSGDQAHGDIHASAEYRAHLASVGCRRLVAALCAESVRPAHAALRTTPAVPSTQPEQPTQRPTQTPQAQDIAITKPKQSALQRLRQNLFGK